MFKMFIMSRRRAGVSLDQFIAYYENNHVPLLGSLFPHSDRGPKAFRRNFINRDDPVLATVGDDRADANPPFDCITEIEFESRDDAEAMMKMFFEPKYLDRIKQDERNFVDLKSIRYYVADVR